MQYLFSAILIIESVIAGYWGVRSLYVPDRQRRTKFAIFFLGIFSFIWSSAIGMLLISDNVDHAFICRGVAMLGVIGFICGFAYFVSLLANVSVGFRRVGKTIASCGIILYFFIIRKGEVAFVKTSWGMTYRFNPTVTNIMYYIYMTVMGVLAMHYILCLLRFNKDKSLRVLGRNLLIMEAVFVAAVLIDTFASNATNVTIPGSALTQFFAFAFLVQSLREHEACMPTRSNATAFIYSSLSLPVLMYDRDEKLYFHNEAVETFMGMDAVSGLSSVLDFAIIYGVEKKSLTSFEGKRTEIKTVCSANHKECIVRIDKICDHYEDVIGYMFSVTDISEQVALMRKVENSHRIKSNYLSNIAQEIRTPMNSIIGFTETLMKGELTDEQRDTMENIRVASYSTVETINEILDFSNAEAGKIGLMVEPYDMSKMLVSVIRQVQTQATQKKLDFVTEIDEHIPSVMEGDVARIREIIYNLVKNAVKYTQEGSVTLRVKLKETIDRIAVLRIEVEDTGNGILETDLDAIFDPYEHLENEQTAGLQYSSVALSIVKGYVEMMQGTIKVKSSYHQGSNFIVEIRQGIIDASPIGPMGEIQAEQESNIGDIEIHDVKVLVVDDNHINLKAVSSALSCYGLDVDTADSGEKAISLCRRNSYPIIFMDQMMPLMDGVDTMMWIRRLSKYYEAGGEGKIVVLTAVGSDDMRSLMLAAGFDEYLKKPVDFALLEDILVRYLPEDKFIRGGEHDRESKEEEARKVASQVGSLLPGVDIATGMLQCGGKNSYYEVLALMVENGPKQLHDLERMVEPDLLEYPVAIHGVKGACYSIGANAVGDQARELEMAAKAGDYMFVREHHEEFAKSYRVQLDMINTFLAQEGFNRRTGSVGFVGILDEIHMAAMEFDIPTVEQKIAELRAYNGADKDEEILAQLEAHMAELDMDGILKTIAK